MTALERIRKVRERLAQEELKRPPRPTAHECFKRNLLPFGHAPYRRTMSPAHQLVLVERYPMLFRMADQPPLFQGPPFAREGFCVGDGWFHLIDRLSAKLATNRDLVVVQVKEKFGELRLYLDHGQKIRFGLAAALEEAVLASRRTCEICGKHGVLAARLRGWLSVRCEPCMWIDDMVEACNRLRQCAWRTTAATFRKDEARIDASKRHVQHLGEAASHQSARRRKRLPGVDWQRLDRLRPTLATEDWTPAKLWKFLKEEAPAIERALR